MKTAIEIINETVSVYSATSRAIDIDGCKYLTEDGRMCAVGRCLINPGSMKDGAYFCMDHDDSIFKEEYRGRSQEFWQDIQHLHDFRKYWNGQELTEAGATYVRTLIDKYS